MDNIRRGPGVLGFLSVMLNWHFGRTRKAGPGEGAQRSAERLRNHRAQWQHLKPAVGATRQQSRADARKRLKHEIAYRKALALWERKHGNGLSPGRPPERADILAGRI